MTLLILVTGTGIAQAQSTESAQKSDGAGPTLQEISTELINPFGSWFKVASRLENTQFQGDIAGADDQSRLRLDMEASWPFSLDSGRSIVVSVDFHVIFGEPTYPVIEREREYVEWGIRQDADYLLDGKPWFGGHGHLSDLRYGVAWGGTSEAGWITDVGLVGVLPTSQDGSIERDQYLLGPELTLGKATGWGILGAQLSHLEDVATVSNAKEWVTWSTSETHLKLFFSYQFTEHWSIISNSRLIFDWEGPSGNKNIIPLGAGVSRMTRWFGLPMKMDLELDVFVASPDAFGPEWQARFSLTPAILNLKK